MVVFWVLCNCGTVAVSMATDKEPAAAKENDDAICTTKVYDPPIVEVHHLRLFLLLLFLVFFLYRLCLFVVIFFSLF